MGSIVALSRNLPQLDSMKRTVLAQTTFIYDRNGVVIAELHGDTNRIIVKSRQIPQVMKDATVAIEDERFYQHHGVDFEGIARALVPDLKAGHVVQGASTITEQFVKNAYVGDERSLARKLREAVLAWQLENKWTKDKILTEYLNTVYYGDGAYGVQAAAETYFHKSDRQGEPSAGRAARGAAQVPVAVLARSTIPTMVEGSGATSCSTRWRPAATSR